MKKFVKNLCEGFKTTPNSVKFWNGLVYLFLIAIGIINLELLGVVLIIGSILALGVILDGKEDNHYWMFGMPLIWVFIIIGVLIFIGTFIWERFISKFNSWLDGEKTNGEK